MSAPAPGRARIAATQPYPRRPDWVERVNCVWEPGMTRRQLIRRLSGPVARDYEVLVLDGSMGTATGAPELIAGLMIARRRRRPDLVLADCNWKPGSGLQRLARRIGMRAIDRAVARYCVYTTAELEAFPRQWGVNPAKMAFTPYYYHLSDEELDQPPVAGDEVFSGGDSLRDYETLMEAAAGLPEVPFHVASARFRPPAPPANAQVGRIPHDEYIQRIRSAAVVVVPLREGVVRTAGLETFLTAMALGKIIITTDSPGIRDYVNAGRTGLIVPPGDAGALREAIAWTIDPANAPEVARIAQAGRESARRDFSPEAFIATLLEVAEGPLAPMPQRPARPFGRPGEGTA